MAGTFDPAQLEWTDADGVALGDLVGDPATAARDDVSAYVELHIEQGPVLERADVPVGVVTTITGQTHVVATFRGEAGHAGTVPMDARRDALAAAAEWMVAAEGLARLRDGLVATVGQLDVEPGARNVIPGAATLSLDVRHVDDDARRASVELLRGEAERIAAARGVRLEWAVRGETGAVPVDGDLAARLEDAVRATGTPVERLPSGAGHDGVAMAAIAPVAMLFVRCERGISHNPAEAVAEDDVAVALDVLERFVEGLA
jgi:allantoate deiminase